MSDSVRGHGGRYVTQVISVHKTHQYVPSKTGRDYCSRCGAPPDTYGHKADTKAKEGVR